MGNRMVRFLINGLFRSDIRDIMTGYRAFSRLFVKNFPVLSRGFEIETEMTIHALDKNFLITEIPVVYRDRPAGSHSKLNTLGDGVRVLKTIVTLFRDYRPLLFFSILSVFLVTMAALLFFPVLIEYFETGLVRRFPTLIVSGVAAIMGMLLWVCGIVLHVMGKMHRQLYELILNRLPERS